MVYNMHYFEIKSFYFGASLVLNPLHGRPMPYVKRLHTKKGKVDALYNSSGLNLFYGNTTAAIALGPTIQLRSGASRATLLHELGHTDQFWGGGSSPFQNAEVDADWRRGTMGYGESQALMYIFLPPDMYNSLLIYNLYNQHGNTGTERHYFMNLIMYDLLFKELQRQGGRV